MLLHASWKSAASPAGSVRAARSLECGKDARQILDQRALELTNFGDTSFRFPETEADIDDWYCPRVINAAKCIRNYAYTCLRPLPRQLVKLFVADNKTQTDACEGSPEVRRDRIIPYFKCLNKAIGGIHECARKTSHALNHINYHVPGANSEKKFQYTCREYHELSCCVQQQLLQSCSPDVTEIAKVYFDRATHSTANFMCRFYPKTRPSCWSCRPSTTRMTRTCTPPVRPASPSSSASLTFTTERTRKSLTPSRPSDLLIQEIFFSDDSYWDPLNDYMFCFVFVCLLV